VTAVETWMRDPYDLYADRVLALTALDPLDQDPGAAEHGTLIHAVLEAFARETAETGLPGDIAGRLQAIAAQQFDRLKVRPGMRAFWEPRFARIAAWLAAEERTRRADGRQVLPECRGELDVAGARGRLTLTAKADRIERLADGTLAILDYKTGTVPSVRQVDLGFAPQLPLEAAIAAAGGFDGVPAAPTRELAYWRLTGGETPGESRRVDAKRDAATLAEESLAGLRGLIDAFADEAQPFHPRPRPDWVPRYSDYDHLARVQEWSAGAGGEDA
jgi:ATP-dependent helicase/nuclease subunit B